MRTLLTLSVLCLSTLPVLAGEISSAYTDYNDKTCRELSRDEESESIAYACKGYGGIEVYWAEGDLRTKIAYGKGAAKHCAAQQTFAQFNHANQKIEWRIENGKAFAAIQRFNVSDSMDGANTKSWLAVTKLEDGQSCRVALVEGAYPDANRIARYAADELSPNFDCRTDTAKLFANKPVELDSLFTGSPCAADDEGTASETAADVSSQYYDIDLKACTQTEKPDAYVFEGSWECPAIKGYSIFVSGADARSFSGFGTEAGNNCSLLKTFNGFNSYGDRVEIRFRNGEPVAAIQRYSVVENPETPEKTVSWLIVNKLYDGTSCHIRYVSGSFPNANERAREVADIMTDGFDCETATPGYDSTTGPPDITLQACSALARE